MLEQIAVLLALTAGLLDPVPIEKVADAEKALRIASAGIPADVTQRFTSAEHLSEADRKAILDVAIRALVPFQPKPEPKPAAKTTP